VKAGCYIKNSMKGRVVSQQEGNTLYSFRDGLKLMYTANIEREMRVRAWTQVYRSNAEAPDSLKLSHYIQTYLTTTQFAVGLSSASENLSLGGRSLHVTSSLNHLYTSERFR
jgi:hypothetical protein